MIELNPEVPGHFEEPLEELDRIYLQQVASLSLLKRLSEALQSWPSKNQLAEELVSLILEETPAQRAYIYVRSLQHYPGGHRLKLLASEVKHQSNAITSPPAKLSKPSLSRIENWLSTDTNSLVVNSQQHHLHHYVINQQNDFELIYPLLFEGVITGIVALLLSYKHRDDNDLKTALEITANFIAHPIHKIRQETTALTRTPIQRENDTVTLAIIDQKQRICYVDDCFEQILGYSPKQIIGQNITTIIAPQFQATLQNLLPQQAVHSYCCMQMLDREGKSFPCDIKIFTQTDPNGLTHSHLLTICKHPGSQQHSTKQVSSELDLPQSSADQHLYQPLRHIQERVQHILGTETAPQAELKQLARELSGLKKALDELLPVAHAAELPFQMHQTKTTLIDVWCHAIELLTPLADVKHVRIGLKNTCQNGLCLADKSLLNKAICNLLQQIILLLPPGNNLLIVLSETESSMVADIVTNTEAALHEFTCKLKNCPKDTDPFNMGIWTAKKIFAEHNGTLASSSSSQGDVITITLPRYFD